ncbi:MAG: SDR family oxidoreductase [Actinomycetota bacterium]|nr:SDR family oxidoreductase [Actinomycetota bacterium]MDD5667792.1 SDR family oxidoreductase [Actinomycetota bacterium]
MEEYAGKTAIVTGGGSGLGRELCIELARAGAKVYAADINLEGAEKTAGKIADLGGRAQAVKADVRDPDEVGKLVDGAVAEGPLDFMFNNAGIIMFGEFRDMSYDDWRHFMESDVMSVIYGTKCAYEVMIRQGHGHIVNTSSIFGAFPFALATGYTAVKHAVTGLSLALRPEAAGLGVKVSVACPGSIDTEVRQSYTVLKGDRELFNSYIQKQIGPNAAALKILRGVSKNKALIAFPYYDAVFWWLYRIHPSANEWWMRQIVRLFRKKCRQE